MASTSIKQRVGEDQSKPDIYNIQKYEGKWHIDNYALDYIERRQKIHVADPMWLERRISWMEHYLNGTLHYQLSTTTQFSFT